MHKKARRYIRLLLVGKYSARVPIRKHSRLATLVASTRQLATFSSQAVERAVVVPVGAGQVEVAMLDHVKCFDYA